MPYCANASNCMQLWHILVAVAYMQHRNSGRLESLSAVCIVRRYRRTIGSSLALDPIETHHVLFITPQHGIVGCGVPSQPHVTSRFDKRHVMAMDNYHVLVELLEANNFGTMGLDDMLRGHGARDEGLVFECDVIVENQRGIKFFGIPLFSRKSLIPLLDPPAYQRLDGSKVLLSFDAIDNYPLPDLDWTWAWTLWYVLMLNDVDELGWMYLLCFWWLLNWHGKYYFGDFSRKRLWARLRSRNDKQQKAAEEAAEVADMGEGRDLVCADR